MIRYLLSFLLLSSVFSVSAQQAMTLEDCIQKALENNLRVKRGYYNVSSAQINKAQAIGNFIPTANVGGSYGLNYGRAINPVTNEYINRNSNTLNFQGTSSVTLFNGFRILNTYRQTVKDAEAADYDLQKTKNDVMLTVINSFITVVFNRELLANAKWLLESSQKQLDRTKAMVEVGSMPISSQLTQEATVASNELNLINQENALNLSMLQLKQAMQVPAETAIDIVVPDLSVEDLTLTDTPHSIYETAKISMPEIKSAEIKIRSAELALSASRGNYTPRLSLNGSVQSNYASVSNTTRTQVTGTTLNTTTPIGQDATGVNVYAYQPTYTVIADHYNQQQQLKDNLFKNLSLQLTIPIFNGLQSRANVQRSVVSKQLAKISKLETENTLRQTIESAYNDALAASRTYTASLKQVKAREEAFRMNEQRYELGALSAIELGVSQNDLNQSKTDLTRAKYNFIFRKKLLDFYVGKLTFN